MDAQPVNPFQALPYRTEDLRNHLQAQVYPRYLPRLLHQIQELRY